MRKTYWHRAIFWTVLLSFGLMLTGKAIACLAPSAMEMSQDKAMDCCMKRCRMETTQAAAKKSCEESRQAFSLQETLSGSNKTCAHTSGIIFSDLNPLAIFSATGLEASPRANKIQLRSPIFRHTSAVPIYTAIQTFLI